MGIIQQIFVEKEGDDEQIGCVWFYNVKEALDLAGVARPRHQRGHFAAQGARAVFRPTSRLDQPRHCSGH